MTAPRCDFCRSPEPAWEYRTRPFTATMRLVGTEAEPPPAAAVLMDEGWLTCERCSELIEAGELGKLSARADAAHESLRPPDLTAHERNLLRTALIALHQAFAGARTGERRAL